MRRPFFAIACGLALALATPAHAQDPTPLKFETYTLPNGLSVVLAEDHSTQVVEVNVWYHVGSRNEVRGRTGFAHLFEHMMFQGSANVPKAQHSALVTNAGGINNGSTTEDRTNFYETLPSNRLNLGLWLEAEHMRSLAVTKDNFENQRQAVKEERRLRVDNQPYAWSIFEGAYGIYDSTTCFPYAHSVIGSMADLDAAQTADVLDFYKHYYTPNNATLTLVGDISPTEAKKLIAQYFGDIPRGAEPTKVECSPKFNTGAVRRNVKDVNANLPAVFQVFRVPDYKSADYPALNLLSTILGGGESSRLNRSLARDKKFGGAGARGIQPLRTAERSRCVPRRWDRESRSQHGYARRTTFRRAGQSGARRCDRRRADEGEECVSSEYDQCATVRGERRRGAADGEPVCGIAGRGE